jgi:hypothetical protein
MDRSARIAENVTGWFVAKQRPADMFGAVFFDLRKKAKELKEKWSQEAAVKLKQAVLTDLAAQGFNVTSFDISLGQYRGSRFVTSAKLKLPMKDEASSESMAVYLRGKYSPKFKLKSFDPETGEAFYNVR